MAQLIKEMVPCGEMVKFCKGGGEADAVAVRIARGYTSRDIVLFCGYHGWHDWYLSANLKSESNLNEHLRPGISAKGVPSHLAGSCIPFEYNNLDSLRNTLEQNRGKVACIIMEPTRFKRPEKGYLEGIRQLADEHKSVLIFDEVVTGFRLARGGAQEFFGVKPDIATFAKAVANGYALAVVAGKAEIMSSQGDNFISSTYWSDTTTLAAGIATLNEIKSKPVIATIERLGGKLISGLEELGRKHGLKLKIAGHGCDFSASFDYGTESGKVLTLYMQEMVARGVYASSVVYTCFTHTDKDVEKVLGAADETFGLITKCLNTNSVAAMLKCPERQIGFRRLV
jgi:glutamate-1-semialdehyde 2,1-aminomutase